MAEDFALQGEPKKRTRKPISIEKRLQSKMPSMRIAGAFMAAFQARYGFPPIINEGRDLKLLNTLIAQWGEPDVLALIAAFFLATRPGGKGYQEIRRLKWHNVMDFYTGAQILRRINGDASCDLSERTALNQSEILKAMGKTK